MRVFCTELVMAWGEWNHRENETVVMYRICLLIQIWYVGIDLTWGKVGCGMCGVCISEINRVSPEWSSHIGCGTGRGGQTKFEHWMRDLNRKMERGMWHVTHYNIISLLGKWNHKIINKWMEVEVDTLRDVTQTQKDKTLTFFTCGFCFWMLRYGNRKILRTQKIS